MITHWAYKPGSGYFGWQVSPAARIVRYQTMDRMRAIERVHYERWGCEVPMMPLSAAQLIDLQADWAELLDGEHKPIRELCGFFAELLALVVHDPQMTANQWLENSSLSELTELGQLAMKVSGIDYEEKKSESASPSIDSPSS